MREINEETRTEKAIHLQIILGKQRREKERGSL
jgi:hypothetical protein